MKRRDFIASSRRRLRRAGLASLAALSLSVAGETQAAAALAQGAGPAPAARGGGAAGADLFKTVAATQANVSRDAWHGFGRVRFDFEGHKAWIVEPKAPPAAGAPWSWTMQWADAYVDRQGCLELLNRGWRHVTIDVFAERMTDGGLKVCRDFQRYLVEKLGFAPKAGLIGMSWGGFFSVRYANAYPDAVGRIYLDAPLLNFDGFGNPDYGRVGPWADMKPEDGRWTDDPRMPVNMAPALARAKIPVLLLYGGQDLVVPPAKNCEPFADRFRKAGGDIRVVRRGLYGHHPHGEDPDKTGPIADFFEGKSPAGKR